MELILLVIILAAAIIGIATAENDSSSNSFEEKYDVKIVNGDFPCSDCGWFYDGNIDSYPFVPSEERPHPPCCTNKRRCLENRKKCYEHDNL